MRPRAHMPELFLRCARTYITLHTTDKRTSYLSCLAVSGTKRVFKKDFIFVSWEAISGSEYSDSALYTLTAILSRSSGVEPFFDVRLRHSVSFI